MWGTETPQGNGTTLRFERFFAHPPEKLWTVIATPEHIAHWLQADATIDLHQGGVFHLAFHNFAHVVQGEILRCEPPHLLEYSWPESAAQAGSIVMWEITPTSSGSRLVLTHFLPARADVADYASGWHWHLDGIAASIAGNATVWQDNVWRGLKQAYEERFSAIVK